MSRGDLTPVEIGTCEGSCQPGGLCTLANGNSYAIITIDPPPVSGVELVNECTSGAGGSCPSDSFKNLCFDGFWSGCPTWPYDNGETRSCYCGTCCTGYGTQGAPPASLVDGAHVVVRIYDREGRVLAEVAAHADAIGERRVVVG